MINATFKITVSLEKRKELLQTFTAILGLIRSEHGCISCNCYVDAETEINIFLVEEWKTRKDLDTHLSTRHFEVLCGAMKLLNEKPDIKFNSIITKPYNIDKLNEVIKKVVLEGP